jgi:hypothetical protein
MQNLGEAPTFETPATGEDSPAQEPGKAPRKEQRATTTLAVSAKSLREIFLELPSYAQNDFLQLGQIFERLAGRGHALLLIVLGIPACLIPGVSVGFGVAILLLSFQMALGRKPFLPRLLRERKMRLSLYLKLQPRLVRIAGGLERLLHPRLLVLFSQPWMMRFYGSLILVLAFLLCLPLPIPFTNMLAGLPILILGIALLERDGVVMAFGLVVSLVSMVAFAAVLMMGAEGATRLWDHFWPG